MEKESLGGVDDLMKRWKLFYTRMGWDKICDFEDKGQLGYMYAIFKDKNIMDLEKRTEKHTKARPITPFCKHPMKRLLNYAAQGWNFLIKQLKGEHFILHKCKDFKAKVKQLNRKWKHVRKKESRSWDISGCYTHIPKGDVLEALDRVIDLVRESPALHDVEGVFEGMKSPAIKAKTNKGIINVPKTGKGPAHWGRSSNMDRVNLTFKQLMDIAKFSLENAYFTMGDKIVQQTVGLPMGDPLSPAMCIATCAMHEMDWMQTLPEQLKNKVSFDRYLDDIFLITNGVKGKELEDLELNFENNCYPKCLVLEKTSADEFLEMKVRVDGDEIQIRHWNKNAEHIAAHGKQRYFKHQHNDSYSCPRAKRGALVGTWTRMIDNTNVEDLRTILDEKVVELQGLNYSLDTIKKSLCHMQRKQKGKEGFAIENVELSDDK